LLGSRITAEDEIYFGADYLYAQNDGVDSTNSLRLSGQYNRLLSERFYYGGVGSFLSDTIADLDYRFDLNAVLGYYLVKNDRASLSFEAGPGYTWESQGGLTDRFANIRVGEKFEFKINSRSKFFQSFSYIPEIGDFSNYSLVSEAGIDTRISDSWMLRTFVRNQYDSTPAFGRKSHDTALVIGLGYALGGYPEPEAEGRRTLKAERKAAAAAMGWTTSGALGFTLAKGNADSLKLTAMVDSAHRSAQDELFFNFASTFGKDNGSTSINSVRASAQYNRLLSDRYFVGFGTGYQRDVIADLDYRITPAAVAGVYLVKNEAMTLSLEAGPGYTFGKIAGKSDSFAAAQAAERFVWAISDRYTLNQATIYNGELADLSNFTLTSTAFIDTDITENLALRVAASYIYDNTPATGREHHDTTLTSGIAVKF
jgi:putative salt-induced outer membrane protein YdiY